VKTSSSSPGPAVDVQVSAEFAGQVDSGDLRASAEAALTHTGRVGRELTLVVTGDAVVREMNARYRGVDAVTDVLAFPANEAGAGFVESPEAFHYLGDVIIAYPRAAAQAEEAGHAVSEELRLLAVHGTLHLLGYDHATPSEEAAMWELQDRILAGLPQGPKGKPSPERSVSPGAAGEHYESPWRSDLLTSFRNAFAGLARFVRTQRNARIHFVIALLAIALAATLGITLSEWAILALTIGFVFVAEMFNSVAELAVDAVTLEFHPLAKGAKDIGAGAVVLAAVVSVIVGLLLFVPRLWSLWQSIG
jgi:rRNA maturation RNase YbeY